MIPLLKRLWYTALYSEHACKRWGKKLLLGVASGGLAFADQIEAAMPGNTARVIRIIIAVLLLTQLVSAAKPSSKE